MAGYDEISDHGGVGDFDAAVDGAMDDVVERMTEEEKVCLSIFVRREKQAEVLATCLFTIATNYFLYIWGVEFGIWYFAC